MFSAGALWWLLQACSSPTPPVDLLVLTSAVLIWFREVRHFFRRDAYCVLSVHFRALGMLTPPAGLLVLASVGTL